MEDENSLHVRSDWQHLSQHVLQVARTWEKFWTDALAEIGEKFSLEDNSTSGVAFIWHLLWLVPLAEELQQRPMLHPLFPLVHHAVIELRFDAGSHYPSIVLYAPEEGVFRATLIEGSLSVSSNIVPLGEGDSEAIVRLLERSVEAISGRQSSDADKGDSARTQTL